MYDTSEEKEAGFSRSRAGSISDYDLPGIRGEHDAEEKNLGSTTRARSASEGNYDLRGNRDDDEMKSRARAASVGDEGRPRAGTIADDDLPGIRGENEPDPPAAGSSRGRADSAGSDDGQRSRAGSIGDADLPGIRGEDEPDVPAQGGGFFSRLAGRIARGVGRIAARVRGLVTGTPVPQPLQPLPPQPAQAAPAVNANDASQRDNSDRAAALAQSVAHEPLRAVPEHDEPAAPAVHKNIAPGEWSAPGTSDAGSSSSQHGVEGSSSGRTVADRDRDEIARGGATKPGPAEMPEPSEPSYAKQPHAIENAHHFVTADDRKEALHRAEQAVAVHEHGNNHGKGLEH